MNFSEFESIMSSLGANTLADISRKLKTSPQAVSNWKARNQVPYHIVNTVNEFKNKTNSPSERSATISNNLFKEDDISFSDVLLIIAQQLKVIIMVPFITVFISFVNTQFVKQPLYTSFSSILLPENKAGFSGLAGIASTFGVNIPQSDEADLSSPNLFPEIINSRTFAKRILNKNFYTEKYESKLPLLSILTHGDSPPKFSKDILFQDALLKFQSMVKFQNEGSFSILSVEADEPNFAKELNEEVLNELQQLNSMYKTQNVDEKISFIEDRIITLENSLNLSQQKLKLFREQNRQILSPALQLEEESLTSDVEIQKGVYLTLKQQLELAKIEEVQRASIISVLDSPNLPLNPSNKNLMLTIISSGVIGLFFGFLLAFFRSYNNNANIDTRKKIRKTKNFIYKKSLELFLDYRVSGITSLMLLITSPAYLGYKSNNPEYFGLYSSRLMIFNSICVVAFLVSTILFIYLVLKKSKARNNLA